jgi:hypothetical protein
VEPHQPSGSFSQADQLRYRTQTSKSSLATQEAECRKIAHKAMLGYGTLPPTKSFELYLVQGIAIPSGGSEKDARVIFSPEFIFVLDAEMESLIGVSVFWNPVAYGDPQFPDFSKSALRSISSRTSREIIFPNIAGSIMIGTKDGVSDSDVRKDLEAAGLRNVQGSSWFWTAECQPFAERSVCRDLEKKLSSSMPNQTLCNVSSTSRRGGHVCV